MQVGKIVSVRKHFINRFSEWYLAAQLGVFSGVLLSPGDTFASASAFKLMASFATEETWGAGLAGIAGLRIFALIMNGTYDWFRPYSPAIRCGTALLSAIAWMTLSLGMFHSNPAGVLWALVGVNALSDLCLSFIIAGEAGPILKRHYASS